MMHTSKVGPKGQVVIPKDLRDEFNILPGQNVLFEDTDNAILIKKQQDSAKIFAEIARSAGKPFMPKHWHFAKDEIDEKMKRILRR